MKRTVYQAAFPLLAVLALTLLGIGIFLSSGIPGTVKAAPAQVPPAQKPDNAQCLSCHTKPGQVYKFPNGDTVSISIDTQAYEHAVHANTACQVCHTNISGFPHPQNTAGSSKEYTAQYKDTCAQCHPGQVKALTDNAHTKLAQGGNPNTPICADCHNPHTQVPIKKDADGAPAASERAVIAGICAKCHSDIVNQFKQSVHGAALFGDSNPDVPACNDCHGVHNLKQARTVEFRLNSPQLCANCHTRKDIMGKYNISTDVMNTYVSDFHGTTVTLFNKEKSGADTNKPVCYDCHGVHDIAKVDDPQRGLEVQKNMLATCQKCHPDASNNFPASWMSHYIATPNKFPLVYYVNLFYKIFIPLVLGGMGLFVLSDILHRLGITGRKPKHASTGSLGDKKE
jgi:hypothetical protein